MWLLEKKTNLKISDIVLYTNLYNHSKLSLYKFMKINKDIINLCQTSSKNHEILNTNFKNPTHNLKNLNYYWYLFKF